jgi:hypothetical protein
MPNDTNDTNPFHAHWSLLYSNKDLVLCLREEVSMRMAQIRVIRVIRVIRHFRVFVAMPPEALNA